MRDVTHGLDLTIAVLEALKTTPLRRFVFCSSSAVYGSLAERPVSETTGPLLPCSTYGASKLAGEGWISAYARLLGFPALICRLGNIVSGDLDRGALLDIASRLMRSPQEIQLLGNGEQARTYLTTKACADALIYLAQDETAHAEVDVVNVSGRGLISTRQLVNVVADVLGCTPRIVAGHADGTWPGDIPIIDLDLGTITRRGWLPPLSADAVQAAAKGIVMRLEQAGHVP